MFKLIFLAHRGWRLIPRRHRRRAVRTAARTARTHGPTVARAVGKTVRGARSRRP